MSTCVLFFQALERFIVDDEAKSALMVEKFQRYGGNPAVSVATALLDGMFALFQQAIRQALFRTSIRLGVLIFFGRRQFG